LLSTGTGGHSNRPSDVSTIDSDDAGKTWQRGEIITQHGEEITPTRSVSEELTPTRSVSEEIINPSETILVELSDGRVMANIRSESKANRRLVTTSADGATKWTKPKFDDALVEPICMASLVRVDGKHIAFSNPANLFSGDKPGAPGKGRDRKNVTVRLSDDDGASWKRSRVISPGISAYSDLASDGKGTVYCFYENGGVDGQQFHTAALTFVKLTLADFEP
jgi:sialidase-1